MKKILIYILSLTALLGVATSCDKGFDEINTNKVAPLKLDPAFLLNQAIIKASFPNSTLVYEGAIVQQMITPNSGVLAGGNFNQENRDASDDMWQKYYRDVMRYTVDVKNITASNPSLSNLYQMARIWNSYAAMILTDTYGDIPYFNAVTGYTEGDFFPSYDPQESIYKDILKELDEASSAIDLSKDKAPAVVLYSGDLTKWKRLGFSLLLRAAMRLTKVDPALAQQYVSKAITGGVMQSNEESAVVRHTALYINEVNDVLNGSESNNYYLAAPFVNYLKSNNDPRLKSIAVRYYGATSGVEQVPAKMRKDTALQVGMPLGYDNNTIKAVATSSGLASFYDYSQLDRTRMGKRTAPMFLVTYSQTQLLLAEAVVRGWTTGDASTYYSQGIEAHMKQLGEYDDSTKIADTTISNFIAKHPLAADNQLEQINTQYWVASFLNGPEAFANFRRTGYPNLTPNPFPGRSIKGDFIRRLTYPDSEFAINLGNVQQATGRQGPDNLDTRVWWDKP